MKTILSTALGTAIGSLIYTALLQKGSSLDWQRALVTGAIAAVLTALLNWKKSR